MNGISDVRLRLHGQELEADHARAATPGDISRWGLFWRRRHTRKALLSMTSEQLRDIGLSDHQAREEGLKPFWRD